MTIERLLTPVLLGLLAFALPTAAGAAGPTSPVTVEPAPEDQGDIFIPIGPTVDQLPNDYVVEEFFITGAATVYTFAEEPVPGVILPLLEDVAYKTRMLVYRPSDPASFNGNLVIEWLNTTAGFDTAPVWHASADYFTREGWVYVGVTNSNQALDTMVGGCPVLGVLQPDQCGDRYLGLGFDDNAAPFEALSQIANLLKGTSASNPLYPGYPVQRLYHAGQSQQGGSMVTYATNFHFAVNDGYFVQASGGARPINFQPPCDVVDPNTPAYPACTPRLQGVDRLVTTASPVPVFRVMTETDMERVLADGSRQDDTPTFRYYETAGTAHVTIHKDVISLPGPDPFFLSEGCAFESNTLADGPILGKYLYHAMWDNLDQQVRNGTAPPHGVLLETTAGGEELARDAFGNVLGGLRLPQLDLPKASYGPRNEISPEVPGVLRLLGEFYCGLAGQVNRFDEATLESLHPDPVAFVEDFNARVDALVSGRFILPVDAALLRLAIQSRSQRKCIDRLNVDLRRVAKAQRKNGLRCLKLAAADRLGGQRADECLLEDPRQSVERATRKTENDARRRCAPAPDFGPREAEPVSSAAVKSEIAILDEAFGEDLDGALARSAADPAGARCQQRVAKALTRCADARLKAFSDCARKGLKAGGVHDPLTLEACVTSDPKSRISKTCSQKLPDAIERSCLNLDTPALFPGFCSVDRPAEALPECLSERVSCRTCLALNRANGVDVDCDQLDDGALNTSCPFTD